MKGLIIKEFMMLKKSSYMLLIYMAFVIFLSIRGNIDSIIMLPILITATASSSISTDESSRWELYSGILPIKRKDVVSSKYILSIIMSVATVIFIAAFAKISMDISESFNLSKYSVIIMGAAVCMLLYPSISYPCFFKLGYSKGWLIMLFIFGAAAGILFYSMKSEKIAGFAEYLMDHKPFILIGAIALFIVSWFISIIIYNKREF